MADWRNRMEQITNKFKFQLNAKGIDNIAQLKHVFTVSALVHPHGRFMAIFKQPINNCNYSKQPLA